MEIPSGVYAAIVGSNGTTYSTLADAFNGVPSGGTITVNASYTDTSSPSVASGKTLTLTINSGVTITKQTGYIVNNGTLTLNGSGTILCSSSPTYNSGLSLYRTSSYGVCASYLMNYGTMNIQGVTLQSSSWFKPDPDDDYGYGKYALVAVYSGTLNFKSGKIQIGTSCFGIYLEGTQTHVNMSGGSITSNGQNTGIYVQGVSGGRQYLDISGGTISSINDGIIVHGASVGMGNVTASTRPRTDITISGNASISGGRAIYQSGSEGADCATQTINMKMTSGTLSGTAEAIKICIANSLWIAGGTVTSTNSNAIGFFHVSASVIIGDSSDGIIKLSSPTITGKSGAINFNVSGYTFKFYDGTLRANSSSGYGAPKVYYYTTDDDYGVVYREATPTETSASIVSKTEGGYYIRQLQGASDAINVSSLTITAPSAQTYTGAQITAKPTVKNGSTTLTEGTHYTLSWSNNTNPGTATVTVTGKGTYTGTKSVNFTINKRAITITAKDQAVDGNVGISTGTGQVTVGGSRTWF